MACLLSPLAYFPVQNSKQTLAPLQWGGRHPFVPVF